MKFNNPATWLLLGGVALVGVAVLAGGGRAAYAENNCQRIVFKSSRAVEDALKGMEDQLQQLVVLGQSEGKDAETIAGEVFDEVMAKLVPGCPKPLPEGTVIYNMQSDLTLDLNARRNLFIDFMAPLLEAGAVGSTSPFLSTQPAIRAAFQ
jgi:hypothetical protein